MSKHFVLNPSIEIQDKEVIKKLRQEQEVLVRDVFYQKREEDKIRLTEADTLKHIEGRVIVKIDIHSKDSHTFDNGQKIEVRRRFNNFNVRETHPVNAIVISGKGIKYGSEILVHPNSIHDSGRVFDYKESSGNIQYYSIPHNMCFAYFDESWKPMPGFDFALRVFRPYEGVITGIEPKIIKDVLYVTTGELHGNVVKTLTACDYEIIYMDKTGRTGSLIRFRPFGCQKEKREEEAVAILNDLTEQVQNKKLLVGINTSDAKTI